ncbi:DUF4040 domain-containing protein [Cardiobacteriaceae bacterium TAE3-ERU3]|nr:DUF4040 domain-containing protein [Cardiobacteriaceae bacterium TAE3-ERU3]
MATVDSRLYGSPLSAPEKWLWCMFPLCGLAVVLWLWSGYESAYTLSYSWFTAIDLPLVLRVDGLALLMLSLIYGVGLAVFVYAGAYLDGHPQLRRLYVLLTAFALAMTGCVLADHLLLLFVFWELTSVLSFLLVSFDGFNKQARQSARQAMLVTGAGGLCLLGGGLWLWQLAGTARLSELAEVLPTMLDMPLLKWAVLLVMLGAFTKSAQFPFQFWLPNAMSAPTPVSAYLHSATMVKLGVYLLARFDAGLDSWTFWQFSLEAIGSLTAGWGMMLALRERDLKRILAWSTVATLGTMVVMIGLPGTYAALGVVTLLVAHALYKAPLFFVAGNVDHGSGTRVIDRLGKLQRKMPWTALVAMLAGLSMAGVPLSLGFVAKDVLGTAKAVQDTLFLTVAANTVFSAIAVAVAGVAAVRIFWQHPGENVTPATAHEVAWPMRIAPLVIALLGLLLGMFPQWITSHLQAAAQAIQPLDTVFASVRFDAEVLRSAAGTVVMTLLLGAAVFYGWDRLHNGFERVLHWLPNWGGAAVYQRIVVRIPRWSAAVTRRLQHGALSDYTLWLVGFTTLALGTALLWTAWYGRGLVLPSWSSLLVQPDAGVAAAVALLTCGAVLTMVASRPVLLLLASGLVGYGSALLFLFLGAPDVALTQFVVETILVIVMVSILMLLQRSGVDYYHERRRAEKRPLTLLLALCFASVMTLALLLMLALPFDTQLSDFFAEQSYTAAHGLNVVNVILVDFRAMDTFGEVSVLLLSLLAAWPLLAGLRARVQARQEAN